MKKFFLFLFAFLFAISGCQNELTVPTSPSDEALHTLDKSTKVVICHKTGNGTFKALEISVNALPAHLAHGDFLPDADGDGYTAEGACTGTSNDCNDSDPNINPEAAEILGDGIDNNCNGEIDEGIQLNTYYADIDVDSFGDPNNTVSASTQPMGYVTNDDDCEDTKPDINPNATEICDGVDNNCNGQIDENLQQNTYFADNDNDGYGDPNNTVAACSQPEGFVENWYDCDDNNSFINPDALEVCKDNMDNDCDRKIDEGCFGPCQGVATINYGDQVYHTAEIGNQCWLRENLNIGTLISGITDQRDNQLIEKYCYNDNEANCNYYGGLYKWNEAMQYETTEGVRGICPESWHIPTATEFQTLKSAVGNDASALLAYINTSRFTALLAGYYDGRTGYFANAENYTGFWSSSQNSLTDSYFMALNRYDNNIDFVIISKKYGFSIRCIKD